ncbi:ADP-ribose pyrophosphatase [Bradyrhizobium sp. AZCC 2262]|uniref:NUDIX hydrolase n=1 Tax=Bradyrhizobium sp. AZCC 2262 TaxID=3117022 RepID=UPI002FEF1CC7
MITKLVEPEDIERAVDQQKSRLRAAGLPESWATLGEVYADQYVRIVRDPVRFPSGTFGTYITIERGHASGGGVIAVPRLGETYVLIRHWRYATGKVHLEFPRGFIDRGEQPEQAIRRELKEEIGAGALSLTNVGVTYADTGLMNIPLQVYAVEIDNAKLVASDEPIDGLEFLTARELAAGIANRQLDDGLTLAALALEQAWRSAGGN